MFSIKRPKNWATHRVNDSEQHFLRSFKKLFENYSHCELNSATRKTFQGGKNRRADVLGKRYGRLVRNDCQLPSTKVFHCFRNTVATKLESAGIPENIAADIVGHDKATMTYGLYSGGAGK